MSIHKGRVYVPMLSMAGAAYALQPDDTIRIQTHDNGAGKLLTVEFHSPRGKIRIDSSDKLPLETVAGPSTIAMSMAMAAGLGLELLGWNEPASIFSWRFTDPST